MSYYCREGEGGERERGVTTWCLVSQVKVSYGKRNPGGSGIGVGA